MRKNNKSILMLSTLAMLLVGCGTNEPAAVDHRTGVEKFADNLISTKGNSTVDVDGLFTSYYLGENAFFYDFGKQYEQDFDKHDCGYLRTEQGVFKFLFGDNNQSINLDYCETVNANTTVKSLTTYPDDLFKDVDLWVEDDKVSGVYTCNDPDVVYAASFIAGESALVDKIVNKTVTLTFPNPKDPSSAKVEFSMPDYDVCMSFSDIGSTKDAVVEGYMENHTPLANLTDYPSAMKSDARDTLGEDIPMYKASYAVTFDADQRVLTDLGCGNVVADFGAELVKNGWILDKNETDNDSDGEIGFDNRVYHKDNVVNNEIVDRRYIQVAWISGPYLDDYNWEKDYYTNYYPKGQLKLSYASEMIRSINAFNKHKDERAKQLGFTGIPNFTSTEDILFTYYDYQSFASSQGFEFFDIFGGEYSTPEVCLTNLNNYVDALENADFIAYDDSELGVNNSVLYYLNNDDYGFMIEIDNKPGTNTFSISFYASEPVSTEYGSDIDWATFQEKYNSMKTFVDVFPEFPTGVKEATRVGFTDMTEFYADLYMNKYEEVYFGYMFSLTYETEEDALNAAKAFSSTLASSEFIKDEDYSLDDDGEEDYYYVGEKSALINVFAEGKQVMILAMSFKEFSSK